MSEVWSQEILDAVDALETKHNIELVSGPHHEFILKEYDKIYKHALGVEAENRRLKQALTPRAWSNEMDSAWHTTIPDMYNAFSKLLDLALKERDGRG